MATARATSPAGTSTRGGKAAKAKASTARRARVAAAPAATPKPSATPTAGTTGTALPTAATLTASTLTASTLGQHLVEPLLAERHEAQRRTANVHAAMNAIEPGYARGNRSQAWSLPQSVLVAMAIEHCVERRTQREAIAMHADAIAAAGLHDAIIERWLSRVHEQYLRLMDQDIRAMGLADSPVAAVAASKGDLVGMLGVVGCTWAMKINHLIATMTISELGKNDYPLLRALEGITEMAKVQAGAQHHEAQTRRVLHELRTKLELAERDGSGRKRTGAEAYREAMAVIDAMLGLGGAAQPQVDAGAANARAGESEAA